MSVARPPYQPPGNAVTLQASLASSVVSAAAAAAAAAAVALFAGRLLFGGSGSDFRFIGSIPS